VVGQLKAQVKGGGDKGKSFRGAAKGPHGQRKKKSKGLGGEAILFIRET